MNYILTVRNAPVDAETQLRNNGASNIVYLPTHPGYSIVASNQAFDRIVHFNWITTYKRIAHSGVIN